MTVLPASEYRAMQKGGKNKFGAVPTTVDGIRFASKREAAFYAELKLREKAGEVYEVELQPRFALVVNGNLVASARMDFKFYDSVEKRNRVVDVKGCDTRESRLHRKLIRAIYGIDVEVVR